ncbi:MAG: TetR/AcrR family transcriptional regulator, partial [Thermocrispum sp.]
RTARSLLVDHGADGVTLRAIARRLGITAPALYRYYDSHSALLEHLRRDIVVDLAAELSRDVARLPEDAGAALTQFFAVCKGFRRWSLRHPREFALVFASPRAEQQAEPLAGATEPFGRVFIGAIGQVLAHHELAGIPDDYVPPALRGDVQTFRTALLTGVAEEAEVGDIPAERLPLGVAYLMVQFWARIYGHVALEVFGNFPMPTSSPDALFDAMLADLAREVGLGPR